MAMEGPPFAELIRNDHSTLRNGGPYPAMIDRGLIGLLSEITIDPAAVASVDLRSTVGG